MPASTPSWHADGERLAVGGENGRAYILHVAGWTGADHPGGPRPERDRRSIHLGRRSSADAFLGRHHRLWETATGRQLLSRVGPFAIDIHPDGPRLGYFTDRNRSVQFVELAGDREYRTLANDLGVGCGRKSLRRRQPRRPARGRGHGSTACGLWDLASGREVVHLQSQQCLSLAFTPDGHALLTSGVARVPTLAAFARTRPPRTAW